MGRWEKGQHKVIDQKQQQRYFRPLFLPCYFLLPNFPVAQFSVAVFFLLRSFPLPFLPLQFLPFTGFTCTVLVMRGAKDAETKRSKASTGKAWKGITAPTSN